MERSPSFTATLAESRHVVRRASKHIDQLLKIAVILSQHTTNGEDEGIARQVRLETEVIANTLGRLVKTIEHGTRPEQERAL